MRSVYYSKDEIYIVESGIGAIKEVLLGDDSSKKQKLLLCLDMYIDPWYQHHLPYEKEILTLLEHVVVFEEDVETAEDALNLLMDYSSSPYPILENQYTHICEQLEPQVRYLLRRENLWKMEEIVNIKCKQIFEECRTVSERMKGQGIFPEMAIIVHDSSITADGTYFPQKGCEGLFSLENNEVKQIGIPNQGIPYEKEPLSGDYYHKAEFYYNIDIDKMQVTLIYFIASRWGKCQVYEIILENNIYALSKPFCIWVS